MKTLLLIFLLFGPKIHCGGPCTLRPSLRVFASLPNLLRSSISRIRSLPKFKVGRAAHCVPSYSRGNGGYKSCVPLFTESSSREKGSTVCFIVPATSDDSMYGAVPFLRSLALTTWKMTCGTIVPSKNHRVPPDGRAKNYCWCQRNQDSGAGCRVLRGIRRQRTLRAKWKAEDKRRQKMAETQNKTLTEQVTGAMNQASETIQNALGLAQPEPTPGEVRKEELENARNAGSEAVNSAANAMGAAKDEANDAVKSDAEQARKDAENAKQTVTDKVDSARQTVAEKMQDALHDAGVKLGVVEPTPEERMQAAGEKTKDAAKDVTAGVTGAATAGVEKVVEVADSARAAVAEAVAPKK
ncbi:hypothetical protein FVE85_1951 [Porphyridium purpureum]|uniref:Uncharacterized protein n=1 Tax=Porphyridium purpureum TaxID=35688 RepID=A0A5J4YWU0_PORPP|nr:hypothetical protein FVE85_1951 [Porphyridium purpureum]|eukprot:POR5249..scf209_3